jgi:galactose-6-phosphate isomerase
MPLLDVNKVLASPNFRTSFVVTRRNSGVDNHGRTSVTTTQFTVVGVINPYGDNTQERPSEYAAGHKSMVVYTPFRLRAQSQAFLPDLITYRGDDYLVRAIEDFTQYGRGFVQAYCTSQDLQDSPPQE